MSATAKDARFWDRIARKYATDKIADAAGYVRTLERTRHYLKPTDRVMEFGCGTGTTALKLAPYTGALIASDISGEMIAIAKEKQAQAGITQVEFVCATLDSLNAAPESFDAVLGFNALHLIPSLSDNVRRVHGFLKSGGLFISKTPCLGEMNPLIRMALPVMQFFGRAPYVNVFNARQLETVIMSAGFEIVEIARHASKGKDARPFIVARKI